MIRPKSKVERTLGELMDFLGLTTEDKSLAEIRISGVTSDSRAIEPGDLFIALPGEVSHGCEFLRSAMERGARAVLTDQHGDEVASRISNAFPRLVVPKPRSICGPVASWFYGQPSQSMYVAGITGTNGKTTTTFLLEQIWKFAELKSGLIGTVGIQFDNRHFPATHTTPESDITQAILATMKEAGTRAVAMEVSSHALVQERVKGIRFSAVGFTNLTQDHLDFHGTMDKYFQAKSLLFTDEYADLAIVSIDGDYGKKIWNQIQIKKIAVSSEFPRNGTTSPEATWYFERLIETPEGFDLLIRGSSGISIENEFRMIGRFNLENLLIAVAIAFESGVDPLVIAEALPHLKGAPGRLERVPTKKLIALVDYAHTPDAVERALSAVSQQTSKRVIAVLGCGGDRDSSKRPLMGRALHEGADIPIFTSDNPRSEDPQRIISQMIEGINLKSGAEVIVDRRAAIQRAVEVAESGDVILVLGKGHETGQEVNGVKTPFNDSAELLSAIEAKP